MWAQNQARNQDHGGRTLAHQGHMRPFFESVSGQDPLLNLQATSGRTFPGCATGELTAAAASLLCLSIPGSPGGTLFDLYLLDNKGTY